MRTKVGIVTYESLYCNFTNYGTVLQAWALQQALRKLLPDAIEPVLVDYCPAAMARFDPLDPMANMWDASPELRAECERVLPAIRENYRKVHDFYHTQIALSERSYRAQTIHRIADEGISHFVCGSDAIWDMTEFDIDACFFADNDTMRARSIAYSVSFQDSFGQFLETLGEEEVSRLLSNFRAIGLRDAAPFRQLQSLSPAPITRTIDPTLLLSASDYQTIMAEPQCEGRYLLYYSRRFDPQMEALVAELAEKRNLQVVEISIRTANEDTHELRYDAGIQEFLSLVKHADYVVTNSFHCLIFSLLFERDFSVFTREHCNDKIVELLELVGLPERLNFAQDGARPIDWADVHRRIQSLRAASLDYLQRSVSELVGQEDAL